MENLQPAVPFTLPVRGIESNIIISLVGSGFPHFSSVPSGFARLNCAVDGHNLKL